jgi:hypothetical protein
MFWDLELLNAMAACGGVYPAHRSTVGGGGGGATLRGERGETIDGGQYILPRYRLGVLSRGSPIAVAMELSRVKARSGLTTYRSIGGNAAENRFSLITVGVRRAVCAGV